MPTGKRSNADRTGHSRSGPARRSLPAVNEMRSPRCALMCSIASFSRSDNPVATSPRRPTGPARPVGPAGGSRPRQPGGSCRSGRLGNRPSPSSGRWLRGVVPFSGPEGRSCGAPAACRWAQQVVESTPTMLQPSRPARAYRRLHGLRGRCRWCGVAWLVYGPHRSERRRSTRCRRRRRVRHRRRGPLGARARQEAGPDGVSA
jgi:hypothetical protein